MRIVAPYVIHVEQMSPIILDELDFIMYDILVPAVKDGGEDNK